MLRMKHFREPRWLTVLIDALCFTASVTLLTLGAFILLGLN